MNIHITIVAHSLTTELRNLIDACAGPRVHWHLFLHSQNAEVVRVCEDLSQRDCVTYYPYGENRGLARSWNEGLRTSLIAGADVTMIANDDVQADYGDVLKIAHAATMRRDCYFVNGMGDDLTTGEHKPMLFALCAINPIALQTIGYFDETFSPIYFEDLDYYRRADLAGLQAYCVQDTRIKHIGSGTRKAQNTEDTFWSDFNRNRDYYISKWGGNGHRGTEQYLTPFNERVEV